MTALDTNVYIYFLEKNPHYFQAAEKAIIHGLKDGHQIFVPSLTLTEILSGTDNRSIIDFFSNPQFIVHDLTGEIAILAGDLRYKNKALKTPDAIHIATALHTGSKEFITNDEYLLRLEVGIDIIELKEFL